MARELEDCAISKNWWGRGREKILGSCPRAIKTVEVVGDGETNSSWCSWNSLESPGKETGGIGD